MATRIYNYNNKTYVCYVGQGCFTGSVEVSVWERKRPNNRIFKGDRYKGSDWFWVEDYNTIEEGVLDCIKQVIQEDIELDNISKKWKEFENKS